MVNLKRHTRPARSISVDSYHTSNKSEDLITNGLVHEKRQPVEPLNNDPDVAIDSPEPLYLDYDSDIIPATP
ncbi:hypothetical protein J6590_011076 [Homalodisca vitripennis]|nr:hypothetical protein J6590_011076 [Homalodisca vitripennis]